MIEQKKDSYETLKNHKKPPRSLRIRCELTASPSYSSNPKFKLLKEKLQDTVTDFIEKGTDIITEWTFVNIQLLLIDRCSNILAKALPILDGLASYHSDVIGHPNWPSTNSKTLPLYLLQIYMSNILTINKDLISYLELPPEVILLTGAKILANTNSEDDALHILQSLQASNLNLNDKLQHTFVTETLLQFNQILQMTTIDIWKSHNHKTTQETAANKLKAKMAALETTNATKATAQAIQNAFSNINDTEKLNANSNLRLANLEKNLKRQEQKTNEISNTLRNKNKNQQQKNYKGSRHLESATPPLRYDSQKPQSYDRTSHRRFNRGREQTAQDYALPRIIPLFSHSPDIQRDTLKKAKTAARISYNNKRKNSTMEAYGGNELLQPPEPCSKRQLHESYSATGADILQYLQPFLTPHNYSSFLPSGTRTYTAASPSTKPFHNNQQNIFNAGAHNHFLQHNLPGVPLPFHHRASLLQNPFIQQKDVKSPKRFQQKRKKSD